MIETDIKKEDYLLIYKTSTTPFFPATNVGIAHSNNLKKVFENCSLSSKMITIVKDGSVSWFYYKDMKVIAEKVIDTMFTHKFIQKIESESKKIEEEIFNIISTKIDNLFDENIFNVDGMLLFENLNKLYVSYIEYLDFPGFLFQVYFAEKFSEDLLKEFEGTEKEKQKKLNILTSNFYETYYEKYLKNLLLAIENKKDVQDIVKENYWLIHDYIGTIINKKYVLEDIAKHKLNIQELREKVNSVPNRLKMFKGEIEKCSDKLKEKIMVYQKLNWFYHERKKFTINQANIFIRKIFEYKFPEINQSELKKLFMSKPDELLNILIKNISFEAVMKKVKDEYYYLFYEGKVFDANPEYKKLIEVEKSTELKGMTAYPGKLKGKARIILNQSQMHLFNSGEILVAPMTNVNYLPLMHKAKAILTETGGLTSHAAIICRELKKPCIVGIKNLINFLKDNEPIEIDADNGIVKKINE